MVKLVLVNNIVISAIVTFTGLFINLGLYTDRCRRADLECFVSDSQNIFRLSSDLLPVPG